MCFLSFSIFLFLILFGDMGVWTQGLELARQAGTLRFEPHPKPWFLWLEHKYSTPYVLFCYLLSLITNMLRSLFMSVHVFFKKRSKMVLPTAPVSWSSPLLGWCDPQVGSPGPPHGKEGSAQVWKAVTYFIALPGVGMSMLNVFLKWHHRQHETQVHHQRLSPFPGEAAAIFCP
jgi:hypothetical protein